MLSEINRRRWTVDVANCCQQSTGDRRLLISLNIQFCLQRDWPRRRAGPAAFFRDWAVVSTSRHNHSL